MANARDLRLQADYRHVVALANESGGALVVESVRGNPPDEYVLRYHCRSIERLQDGKPVYRDLHRVRVKLPAKYPAPSAPPVVEMLTPIFHPHVYPNLAVCMGSWQTSEYLEDFLLRLGALLQYDRRYLNVRDPANVEAVEWAHRNLILLPTDTRTFGPEDAPAPPADETPATPPEDGIWLHWEDISPL